MRLIRDGEMGGREVGEERDYIPILHCHYRYKSCIKMGSDESFYCFINCEEQSHIPQPTTFEEKGQPKRYRTEVLLLTGLTPYR